MTVLESSERFRMPGVPTHARIIRFGLYEVDLAARELRRDGAKVKLQDRPFEVLTILIERPGDVVAREEFRQRLWPADTFVDFDSSLNTSINKLRQALSDDAENPRFIATVGRRGYRFIAPTSVPPESAGSAASAGTASTETREDSRQERNPSRRPRLTATVAGIAAILFIMTLYRRLQPRQMALRWGLPFVLGGALGNVFDRVRYGQVIDFIDAHARWGGFEHHWPTFNIADVCICVGVGLMAIDMFSNKRGTAPLRAPRVPPAQSGEPVPAWQDPEGDVPPGHADGSSVTPGSTNDEGAKA